MLFLGQDTLSPFQLPKGYSMEQFQNDLDRVGKRPFDTYLLAPFIMWFAWSSKTGMGRWTRRMLFTSGLYMFYRNVRTYREAYEKARAVIASRMMQNGESPEAVAGFLGNSSAISPLPPTRIDNATGELLVQSMVEGIDPPFSPNHVAVQKIAKRYNVDPQVLANEANKRLSVTQKWNPTVQPDDDPVLRSGETTVEMPVSKSDITQTKPVSTPGTMPLSVPVIIGVAAGAYLLTRL